MVFSQSLTRLEVDEDDVDEERDCEGASGAGAGASSSGVGLPPSTSSISSPADVLLEMPSVSDDEGDSSISFSGGGALLSAGGGGGGSWRRTRLFGFKLALAASSTSLSSPTVHGQTPEAVSSSRVLLTRTTRRRLSSETGTILLLLWLLLEGHQVFVKKLNVRLGGLGRPVLRNVLVRCPDPRTQNPVLDTTKKVEKGEREMGPAQRKDTRKRQDSQPSYSLYAADRFDVRSERKKGSRNRREGI